MNPFKLSTDHDIAWCPGCGNFAIIKALEQALDELELKPEQTVLVSGIGQAAKTPQYIHSNYFNGLHGRSLSASTAIKAANPSLEVINISGDGCTYGEGGNHFIHTIRRNPNITNIVHNNMVYGLTKGQASPTSQKGFKTPVQTTGVYVEPFNPIAIALTLGATFVARAFSGDHDETVDIFKKAIAHKGYSLVDIFQPCVSFNKINTFKWYKDHTYYLDDMYNPSEKGAALEKAFEEGPFPLGIIYDVPCENTFEDNLVAYKDSKKPLYQRRVNATRLKKLFESYK